MRHAEAEAHHSPCPTPYQPCNFSSRACPSLFLRCRCCTFDNRGIGSSSIPEHLSTYKTGIMAGDVRALMDHLGWQKAHIMGMSLGGETSSQPSLSRLSIRH